MSATPPREAERPPRVSSATLLRGQREIEIAHDGRIYRLRLTASGKLILTC